PCAVGYLTSDIIDRGVTVDLRYLLRRGRLTIWRRHVDCPRDRLVQIRLVGTINLLTRWRLGSWCYRMVVVDTSLPMFNLDSNVIRVSTSKGNRLWCISLAIFQNPASRNIGFNRNSLSCLTIDRICLDLVAILVNIDNISGLIFRLID